MSPRKYFYVAGDGVAHKSKAGNSGEEILLASLLHLPRQTWMEFGPREVEAFMAIVSHFYSFNILVKLYVLHNSK